MSVASLVGASLLVAAGATLAVSLFDFPSALERLLAWGVVAVSQVVVTSVAAGALAGRYEPGIVFAVNALCVALLLAALVRRGGRVGLPGLGRFPRLEWWQWSLLGLAAAAIAWRAVLAFVLPPFAYDSLTYHLTAVAQWVQEGSIAPNDYSLCCARYPHNGEVVAAWPALFLGRDALVDLPQVGFALLGALATGSLARSAGVAAGGALAAGALFALTPVVLAQANVAYVDVATVAMLLSSLALLARFLEAPAFSFQAARAGPQPRWALLVPGGLAAGLALGTKQIGIPMAGVLVVLVFAHLVRAALRGRVRWAPAAGGALLFLACILVTGGYWYVRNVVEVGSPVWPVEVQFLGTTVFSGPTSLRELLTVPPGGSETWWLEIARSWSQDLLVWRQSVYSYEQRLGGLGPVWIWLSLPAAGFFALLVARRRPTVAVNVLLPLAIIFALQPYRWWARFTLYLACVGAIGLVYVVQELRGRRALAQSIATATVVLAATGAAIASWKVEPGGRADPLTARQVLGLVDDRGGRDSPGRLFFDEYRWVDDVPPEATIGVERSAEPIRFLYPFFGHDFGRRVTVLPPGGARLEASLDYVVVGSNGAYDRRLRASASRFRPIADSRGMRAYRRSAPNE